MPTGKISRKKEVDTIVKEDIEDKYATIKLPRLSFNSRFYTPIFIIVLVVGSFFLGSLYTKVTYLEKNQNQQVAAPQNNNQGQNQQPQSSVLTVENYKKWAKELGMDSGKFDSCVDGNKYEKNITDDESAGQKAGVEGTPTTFVNGEKIVGAQPYDQFKTVIDKAITNGTAANQADFGKLPVLGNENASVAIVVYSDFECPFCQRFYTDAYTQIKKDYVDTGKAKIYFRHYPLPFHASAKPAANAAECANEQGKFWEMHDKLFEAQSS